MEPSSRWQDGLYPLLLVAGVGAAYLAFACPYVLGGDCAEYLALAARGGVAHPPGYPLQTLVLRAFTGLAAGAVPLGAARVTAATAAAAAGMLYAACRSYRASPEAAVVAAMLYATSPLAWEYATQVEVFALAALLEATLLSLSGPASPVQGVARLGAIAFVTGLGLSHHHTILALGPVALLGGVRALHECGARLWLRAAVLAFLGLALGLAPYGYLVWVSHHPEGRWVWGDPMGAHELLRHFERAEYWEAQAKDLRTPMPSMHFAALEASMARGLLWLGVPLAVLGLLAASVRGFGRGGRRSEVLDALALLAGAALAGPALLSLLVGKPVGIYAIIIERFHLLPQLIAAVPVALGVDVLRRRLAFRAGQVFSALLLAGTATANALMVPADLRETERPTVEHYLRNTLAELPVRSVMVGNGDHRSFGFFFLQTILGARPDVTYVEAGLLRDGWYRQRIARALGLPIVDPDPRLLVERLTRAEEEAATASASIEASEADQANETGRPVFVTDSLDTLVPAGHATYAVGTVVRVLPSGWAPPDADGLEADNVALAAVFVREADAPADPWSWSGEVDAMYARPFSELAGLFTAQGMPERARKNLERSGAHGRLARDP